MRGRAVHLQRRLGEPIQAELLWRRQILRAVTIAAALCGAALAADLPINPDVSPATARATICVPGWTKTVRPPVAYTNRLKRALFDEYGLPPELMADFQLDHIIPLALGGAPSDPKNFQLMDADDAERKDGVERCLARAVCAGIVSLEAAREAIWADWKQSKKLCAD